MFPPSAPLVPGVRVVVLALSEPGRDSPSHQKEEAKSHELEYQTPQNDLVSYRDDLLVARSLDARACELAEKADDVDKYVDLGQPAGADHRVLFGAQGNGQSCEGHIGGGCEEGWSTENHDVL